MLMTKIINSSILFSLALMSCTSTERGAVNPDDSYLVYSEVLGYLSEQNKVSVVVVDDSTRIPLQKFGLNDLGKSISDVDLKAIETDFYRANERSMRIDSMGIMLEKPIYILDRKDYQDYLYSGSTTNIPESLASGDDHGMYILSRPGFDTQRTHCLIYVEFFCGPQCAMGHYLLLKKASGSWSVSEKVGLWAS